MFNTPQFGLPERNRSSSAVGRISTLAGGTLDRSNPASVRLFFNDEPVAQPLVVALAMIMYNEFVNQLPQ